jgi:L-threonylcarbamoyladenylate synthase
VAEFSEIACDPQAATLDEVLGTAIALLDAGGLLGHPTSTVYGIGGQASEATDKVVLGLKGSPSAHPYLRLVADAASVSRLYPTARWTSEARRLVRELWPGPLTIVLDDGSPAGLAVRAEPHPVLRRLLAHWGGALSSTSLNRSGRAPATNPGEARETLASFPSTDLPITFLNCGSLSGPPPSTLVSAREGSIRLLREGAIPAEIIEACLGESMAR